MKKLQKVFALSKSLLVTLTVLALCSCNTISTNPKADARDASKKIHKGMTQAEVKTILGPPRTKMIINSEENWSYSKTPWFSTMGPLFGADYDEASITIKFNSSGRVSSVNTTVVTIPSPYHG